MTHVTLSKPSNSNPSLEYYSDSTGDVRRVTIESFPFRIGRTEAANLRIDSAQVSREHAEIVERNGMWMLRDLGSTNGTQVNGTQVTEALLSDRDVIKVAETELTFVVSAASQFQRMVTQPIKARQATPAPYALAPEVAAVRTVIEASLWQAIPTRLLTAKSLRHGVAEAVFAPSSSDERNRFIFEMGCPVAEHYRHLDRRRALELAIDSSDSSRLFFSMARAETESPHRVFSSLMQWQSLLPAGWELGVTISLPTDVDIVRIGDVYRLAREHELLVAFDRFQGNGGQVMHLKSFLPDYLLLDETMTKDLTTTRQPLRRLESLLAGCDELAVKPVLPCNESGHTIALCQEIGFDLVLEAPHGSPASQVAEPCLSA